MKRTENVLCLNFKGEGEGRRNAFLSYCAQSQKRYKWMECKH